MAGPQLAPCASSGRAWWLWAACTPEGRSRATGRTATASSEPPPKSLTSPPFDPAGPIIIGICGEAVHAVALCNMGATVIGAVASHMVELYLRTNYAERVQERTSGEMLAEDKRRLEVRNEQLEAEKERLMYDVQRRTGCALDDDDARSAIRRGLQAGHSQPTTHPARDAHLSASEAGGPAPSDAPPPSLPPGAPSSAASGSMSGQGLPSPESAARSEIAAADALADMATAGCVDMAIAGVAAEVPTAIAGGTQVLAHLPNVGGTVMATAVIASAAGAVMATTVMASASGAVMASAASAEEEQHADPSQGVDSVSMVEADGAAGPKPAQAVPTPTEAVIAAEPEHQALEEALHRIQLAHTDMEVFKVVNLLAVALGARRTEMGTVKALHAVLLQLVRPGISNAEACNATGASTSNFSKWRRQVQKVQLDHHLYLAAQDAPAPAATAAPPT